jgi:hypothetical protein
VTLPILVFPGQTLKIISSFRRVGDEEKKSFITSSAARTLPGEGIVRHGSEEVLHVVLAEAEGALEPARH